MFKSLSVDCCNKNGCSVFLMDSICSGSFFNERFGWIGFFKEYSCNVKRVKVLKSIFSIDFDNI